jgi:DNA-binding transcriptional MerR regulator
MGIFKAKKSDLAAGPDIPMDQVSVMKQQGYNNNQIIQTLQRDGYTSSQIFDAMSQSEAGSMQTNDMQNAQMQQLSSQLPPMQQMPQSMQQNVPQNIPMNSLQSSPEELVEAIIDEKWNELVKDINKVIEWKQKADTKLATMDQQINDLSQQFDKLHSAIIGKIGDYDKHMVDVGAELQAMEKVFSKVLPTFVDNVNDLNAITQRMKVDRSDRFDKKPSLKSKTRKEEEADEE